MGDEDFMAALSRAFAESEQQRASAAQILGDDEAAPQDEDAEEAGAEQPRRDEE